MNEYPIIVKKIQNDIYADDLVSAGTNLVEVELFSKGFNLCKVIGYRSI